MKRIVVIIVVSLVLASCSDFQRTLKSDDVAKKFELGTELYDAGKYSKAYRLFDQILPKYRGKPQGEKLTYMHAKSSYELKDYYFASYHFNKFVNVYPDSEKVEEASFLEAKGYYFGSPIYSKEQKETIKAIEKLQLFINGYPDSEYLPEANALIKELDFKLEKKAYEIAKQYDLIRDYKASIKSFNNFLLEFPGTTLREKALFYRFDAAFNLADKSIAVLKEDRLNEAINYYKGLKKAFPNSEYISEATEMKEKLEQELSTITTKS